jgi:histone H2B
MLAALTGRMKGAKKDKVAPPVIEELDVNRKSTSIESAEKSTPRKEKTKRKHARATPYTRTRSWDTYLFRVLKQVHPDHGITRKSMAIMNSFVEDIYERILSTAAELARKDQRHTLTTREIQSAVRLVLPGELATHAVSEGLKAYNRFLDNTKDDKAI